MWCFIIAGIILLVELIWILLRKILDPYEKIFALIIGGGLLFGLSCFTLSFTTGLNPNYSSGEMSGYLIAFGEEGIIWKTYEGKLQPGVGEQNAAQETQDFTVSDQKVIKKIGQLLATKTRVKLLYKRWLILPFKTGFSNTLVYNVQVMTDE